MDWDLKFPSWELAELEQHHQEAGGSSVGKGLDLKLGGSGDCGSPEKRGGASGSSAAVPGPSKRARAPGSGGQNVGCLVDGCTADLSGCREYHRRHKVCEVHSKTPIVIVGGREQRFCQQCSRFHLLVEFDEVKRSCRKRLDGHNRRRRKPQPDALNAGNLFSLHQGPRFSSYPHVFPLPAPDPAWAAFLKAGEDMANRDNQSFQLLHRQNHSPPNSTFRIFKEGKQFPFLHDDDMAICNGTTIVSPACQPFGVASSSDSCGRKMFPDRLSHALDTDCALSLLSSPSQTPAVSLSPMVPSEGISFRQHIAPQFGILPRSEAPCGVSTTGFTCSVMNVEQLHNDVLVPDSGNHADLGCHGFYSAGGSGSSDGHPEALPFSW